MIHGDFGLPVVILDDPQCGGTPADGLVGFSKARCRPPGRRPRCGTQVIRPGGGWVRPRALCRTGLRPTTTSTGCPRRDLKPCRFILRVERLARVFRLTSDFVARFHAGDQVESVVEEIVAVMKQRPYASAGWRHTTPAFVEALGSLLGWLKQHKGS